MSIDRHEMIEGLRQALNFSPENIPLRKHLAETLLSYGEDVLAEKELKLALRYSPKDFFCKMTLIKCYLSQGRWTEALVLVEDLREYESSLELEVYYARALFGNGDKSEALQIYQQARLKGANICDELESRASQEMPNLEDPIPQFIDEIEESHDESIEMLKSDIDFESVGGMEQIKDEIRMKIIHPLKNKDLFAAYGKKIGGGVLMYGPPGCGKTHLARATAGEINASFISVGLNDVLSMYIGQSEDRLHQIFEQARRNTPCVLFFDEVDALAASRSDLKKTNSRHLINQFLAELDGVEYDNEGVLVLAATNSPWHIDAAFRRPGRFDRIIFVAPPDEAAKQSILKIHLKDKPQVDVDYNKIAKKAKDFSGADLCALIDITIEAKLEVAMKTGKIDPVSTKDILKVIKSVKLSTKDWFSKARNYALYSNDSGLYDDVLSYLER